MRSYWGVDQLTQAKFERVSVFTDADKMSLEEKEVKWEEVTREHMRLILSRVPYDAEWRVLDLGCAVGRMLLPMSGVFRELVGVDISPKMIDHSRSYLAGIKNVSTMVGSGFDLRPLENGSFDMVYSIYTFQHFPRIQLVENYLKEINRVLRPGGWLALQTCTGEDNPWRWFKRIVVADFGGVGFSPQALTDLVESTDFDVASTLLSAPAVWVFAPKKSHGQ